MSDRDLVLLMALAFAMISVLGFAISVLGFGLYFHTRDHR